MPFAGFKDFADCVSQNGDKADPHAYCATIMAATEKAALVDKALRKASMMTCPDCGAEIPAGSTTCPECGVTISKAQPTASVDGTAHPASDFAYVPDASKPSTWKFPIFDAAHARNALARFDQADLPADAKAGVKAKIEAAARKHGVTPADDTAKSICKVDEEQRMVFGWANVAMMDEGEHVVDLQGDIIDGPTLEKAAYDYARRYRVVNDMHQGAAVGDLVEMFVVTPEKLAAMGLKRDGAPAVGMWVGYKLDEGEWAAYKRGERPMFSIEGEAHAQEA